MLKTIWSLLSVIFILTFLGCGENQNSCEAVEGTADQISLDSLATALNWPEELKITSFTGPDLTPSPACLAVAPSGEVFVGVDMMGSLGKEPGKGSVIKLIDCNNDGILDNYTTFATLDNPRGLLPIGNKLFVLHTIFSKKTGKASGMDLVVFEDKDNDGVADGPSKPLIQSISSPKFLQDRGTDHATNGIRMGIDGWIYIAIGDFGFHDALDRSGKRMTMLGGGIVRVRPDGKEMEVYTHGLRNIYDVAIDPYMNIYTRGNTNDGGGWNIRFIHQIQSGEYGYPVLFKHFTDEILPALVDVGGGSGTGSLFMDDSTWPEKFNNVPMMADWGRSQLYIHRVSPDGPSFKQQEEEFIKLPQITDLDIDASGRLYMSAWDGAGYTGDSSKGFVVRAVPKNWQYQPFPNLKKSSVKELAELIKSGSAVARLHAQQELITRSKKTASETLWEIASDESLPLYARVAGIFGYAQVAGEDGIDQLVALTSDNAVTEFALRALADRKTRIDKVPVDPFLRELKNPSKRVQIAAIVGLGRLNRLEAAKALLEVPVPESTAAPAKGTEGPHALPNSSIIPAHIAVRSLVSLQAVDACIDAIGGDNTQLALWALRYMHDTKAIDGLINAYDEAQDEELKKRIISTVSRLYKKEAPYDGSWWWGTRPDTHGPYYKSITWEASDKIRDFLREVWSKSNKNEKLFFADLNGKHRMGITEFGGEEETQVLAQNDSGVDLEKIRNKKGQIGKSSIEDVMLAMAEIKGDAALGKKLFTQQGCVACHHLNQGEVMKGPFMGQIGSIMNREQIAESILKPNASISQGFASVQITAKGDKSYVGFISQESADQITIRNIVGQVFTIKTEDVVSRRELETSMMPPGLANSLSYEEFASLITFLSEQKE
ncbi:c-type cytochrome [Fulvivirgaceae bacterium BMA10]|uniref:C-type cytochrome n=1 Tax=Splendidivirga corallicola TaxID=3051826 RepID=A0ABT8KHR9_9BACT|nr:c-type cytochrome [Fulvivirgaceae bacterium BMA10]